MLFNNISICFYLFSFSRNSKYIRLIYLITSIRH
nr:MAG TPA: hypothetical protein [Crassvirales sp.]